MVVDREGQTGRTWREVDDREAMERGERREDEEPSHSLEDPTIVDEDGERPWGVDGARACLKKTTFDVWR